MSRASRGPPTRTELLRARRRLERERRGAELLRRKREALVSELFRLARPAVDAREAVEERARLAYAAYHRALAEHGETGVRAEGWPSRELRVTLRTAQVWGVPVADIVERPAVRRPLDVRGTAPGLAGPALVEAAGEFELLVDLLLEAAPREVLLRRLGETLARTSRQVHALEERVGPTLEERAREIGGRLEERAREDRLRLKHFLRKRGRRGAT